MSALETPHPLDVADLIDAWHDELVARGYSRDTMQTRRKHVRRVAADVDVLTCSHADLLDWLEARPWRPTTRRTCLSAVRLFAVWLIENGHRDDDPTAEPDAGDRNAHMLAAWTTWQLANGKSPQTVRLYRTYLRRFARRRDLATCTADDVAAWLARQTGWNGNTRRSVHNALRSWFTWALRQGHRDDDPTALLDRVREPAALTRVAPADALARALDAADDDERVMLLLAAHGGLRRAEIARVHSDDLHGEWLTVHGKGGKLRRVPLGPQLADLLRGRPIGWAFPSPARPGEHVSVDRVGRRLSALLGPGWSAHALRHRFATTAYAGTADLLSLQSLLGHGSANTTKRYVHLDDDALRRTAAAARTVG